MRRGASPYPVALWTVLAALTFLAATTAHAAAADLKMGQPAPDFALPDETGKIHHLTDYRGKTVVLMFYPKDFTPG